MTRPELKSSGDLSSVRTALITGVGRPNGIGFAVAQRLAGQGYRLALHAFEADAPRLEVQAAPIAGDPSAGALPWNNRGE